MKYELVDMSEYWVGRFAMRNEDPSTFKQLKALKDFGDVKKGDLGGILNDNSVLPQDDDSWIYADSEVRDSRIENDSIVKGSQVSDATISNSKILCNSDIEEVGLIKDSLLIGGVVRNMHKQNIENSTLRNTFVDHTGVKDSMLIDSDIGSSKLNKVDGYALRMRGGELEDSKVQNVALVDSKIWQKSLHDDIYVDGYRGSPELRDMILNVTNYNLDSEVRDEMRRNIDELIEGPGYSDADNALGLMNWQMLEPWNSKPVYVNRGETLTIDAKGIHATRDLSKKEHLAAHDKMREIIESSLSLSEDDLLDLNDEGLQL